MERLHGSAIDDLGKALGQRSLRVGAVRHCSLNARCNTGALDHAPVVTVKSPANVAQQAGHPLTAPSRAATPRLTPGFVHRMPCAHIMSTEGKDPIALNIPCAHTFSQPPT